MEAAEIAATVKKYILEEFLPGEDPDELTHDTPLITDGIIDSIAALRLVGYIEETFNVELAAHEADSEHLDTIDRIVNLVQSKD